MGFELLGFLPLLLIVLALAAAALVGFILVFASRWRLLAARLLLSGLGGLLGLYLYIHFGESYARSAFHSYTRLKPTLTPSSIGSQSADFAIIAAEFSPILLGMAVGAVGGYLIAPKLCGPRTDLTKRSS